MAGQGWGRTGIGIRARVGAAGVLGMVLTGCSGSGSAPVTTPASPAAAADFTLAVSPSAQTVTAGAPASSVTLLATGSNGFTGPVAVNVNGLGSGVTTSPATISLTPGTAATVTLTATSAAAAGAEAVTFTGTSGSLSHQAPLALTVAPTAVKPPAGPDVTTYHYDNTRQGWNGQETILTPGNVASATFGLKGLYALDGKVDAAPLYLGAVALPAGATNVLYAATEHDSVYALDAASGAQIWKTSVLGAGETTSDPHNCNQISPEIGITSTPVIDRSYGKNGAIFVVGMTKDANGGYHQRLHALDLTMGAELAGSPSEITATYPGTGENSSGGNVIFDPAQYAERVGLLLVNGGGGNGTIYLGWTSHCDIQPYTGWVMGYSEATLTQTSVLNLTPNGSEGSIWMSGYGMAADGGGNIFFLDANGTLDTGFDANGFPSKQDYGNAILKLSTTSGLKVADYWEPSNTQAESAADVDLGSGGAMLLPNLTDAGGAVHHLVVGAGKDTNIYVADRDNMGKFHAADNSNLYQSIAAALPGGAWSGPAYFNNTVYYGGVKDVLRAYTITNAKLGTTPSSTSTATFGYPGTTPSVSSNGSQNGIVWAVESGAGSPAVLHAYDATNLAHELYNSNQAAAGRDAFGNGNKFITPVVANGRVYVGTPTGMAAFGLLE